MVSLLGKNVVKYAEVGYQRIGASLPTRMADDELANFASLSSELCDKCQVCVRVCVCWPCCDMCLSCLGVRR